MGEYVLVLSCGHVVADTGATYPFCTRHNQNMEIVARNAGYSYRCYNCPAGGKYGLAKLTAEHKMSAHLRKYPSHKAAVKLGDTVIETAGFTSQPELPFQFVTEPLSKAVDPPPF